MKEKCYSRDGERFYDDIDDFIDEFYKSEGVVEIEEGESVPHTITDFLDFDSLCEQISAHAEDECGEAAEEYFYFRFRDKGAQKKRNELEKSFFEVVEKWATENNVQPTFYGVKNIRKIRVRIDVETGDYEIL